MNKTKQMCVGCRNDFYNHNQPDGCWSFKNAKVVKKVQVGTWQPPPYSRTPRQVLSCYHAEGYSFLNLDDCRIKDK